MKLFRLLLLLLIVLITLSCSSKKNILYVQDLNYDSEYNFEYKKHVIKPGDILKISILSENPESLNSMGNDRYESNEGRQSLIFKGYTVNNLGFINYPQIGMIKLSDLTIEDTQTLLSNQLSMLEILTNPIVDVKVLNLNFTVLGEVNNPGKYFYDDHNLNLLKALGMAGDLTINGVREDIKLIRNVNGNKRVFSIDLTNSKFLTEDSFQIFSDDIIIVNPNLNRVKNAGIIGNSGTLLSLLSFLMSTIILITN